MQRQRKSTESIIYSIRDAVIVTDASDRLMMANNSAKELLNFTVSQDTNESIKSLINEPELVDLIIHSRDNKLQHLNKELTFDRDG